MKIQLTGDSPVMFKLIPETIIDGIIIGGFARSCGENAMKLTRVKLKEDGTLLINVDDTWPDFKEHGSIVPSPLDGMSRRELAHMTIRAALDVEYDPELDFGESHGSKENALMRQLAEDYEAFEDFPNLEDVINCVLESAQKSKQRK